MEIPSVVFAQLALQSQMLFDIKLNRPSIRCKQFDEKGIIRVLEVMSLSAANASTVSWPDFYFTPNYGAAAAVMDGGEWFVATWNDGKILFPFIKRKLPDELSNGVVLFDVISPYGYSGTYVHSDASTQDFMQFRKALSEYFVENKVVSEFQRQGSLVSGAALMNSVEGHDLCQTAETVLIPTNCTYESAWDNYEGRARTKARKAKKLGYSWKARAAVVEDVAPDSEFRVLYNTTMSRLDASEYYFFSDEYFARLVGGFKGNAYSYEVRSSNDEAKIAGVFFTWNNTAHLHLVGNDLEAMRDGTGNLSYDGLIQWCCENPNIDQLHVGGGVSGQDSLFKFKQSFGGKPTPFYVSRTVHMQDEFDTLCGLLATQQGVTSGEVISRKYFPQYRSPKGF